MKVISFIFFAILVSCAQAVKSSDPIESALSARNESYRQCYFESEQYKGRNSVPAGKMVINFTVLKSGKVVDEKIVDTTFPKDPNFQSCVLEQIRKTPFGEIAKDTNVNHPINFLPVNL